MAATMDSMDTSETSSSGRDMFDETIIDPDEHQRRLWEYMKYEDLPDVIDADSIKDVQDSVVIAMGCTNNVLKLMGTEICYKFLEYPTFLSGMLQRGLIKKCFDCLSATIDTQTNCLKILNLICLDSKNVRQLSALDPIEKLSKILKESALEGKELVLKTLFILGDTDVDLHAEIAKYCVRTCYILADHEPSDVCMRGIGALLAMLAVSESIFIESKIIYQFLPTFEKIVIEGSFEEATDVIKLLLFRNEAELQQKMLELKFMERIPQRLVVLTRKKDDITAYKLACEMLKLMSIMVKVHDTIMYMMGSESVLKSIKYFLTHMNESVRREAVDILRVFMNRHEDAIELMVRYHLIGPLWTIVTTSNKPVFRKYINTGQKLITDVEDGEPFKNALLAPFCEFMADDSKSAKSFAERITALTPWPDK